MHAGLEQASPAGEPVFFGNMRAELIRLLDGKEDGKRLRQWVRTVPLEVDDQGVIMDIDTPDAYQRAVDIAEKRAIFSQSASNNERPEDLVGRHPRNKTERGASTPKPGLYLLHCRSDD